MWGRQSSWYCWLYHSLGGPAYNSEGGWHKYSLQVFWSPHGWSHKICRRTCEMHVGAIYPIPNSLMVASPQFLHAVVTRGSLCVLPSHVVLKQLCWRSNKDHCCKKKHSFVSCWHAHEKKVVWDYHTLVFETTLLLCMEAFFKLKKALQKTNWFWLHNTISCNLCGHGEICGHYGQARGQGNGPDKDPCPIAYTCRHKQVFSVAPPTLRVVLSNQVTTRIIVAQQTHHQAQSEMKGCTGEAGCQMSFWEFHFCCHQE